MSEGCQLYEELRMVTGIGGELEQTGPTCRISHNDTSQLVPCENTGLMFPIVCLQEKTEVSIFM